MELSYEVVELPTRHDFRIARERSRVRRSVWVRLRASDGLEGWGEAAATPYYGETAETVIAVLPVLADALRGIGDDYFALERAEALLAGVIGRSPSVRAALSAALHDLVGKRLGVPVWKLWGLDPAAAPPSSFTLAVDEPELLREKVREAASYPILKLKLGTERDEELLAVVRAEAPHARIRVDANTAWSAKEAVSRLRMLELYQVELLEQPVPAADLEGMRLVRSRASMPVIADEACRVSGDVPRLAGCVDGVNVKLAKCGSLREALRLIAVARAHRMSVMLGCMIESTLGIAAAMQLSSLVDYTDLDGAALLARDPFVGPALQPDGRLRLNTEPGLGVERAR